MKAVIFALLVSGCGGADVFVPAGDGSADGASSDGSSEGSTINDASGDAPFDANACQGKHPIVDAGARYCEPGECYCMPSDKCLPMVVAQACCSVPVKCN